MLLIAAELEAFIEQHLANLYKIPENEMSLKPTPVKWSKKEIMGHLVDSAQNNIRRFVLAQYEEEPHIIYNQDKWVRISCYQEYNTPELINLWYLLNKHIAFILKNTSIEMSQRRSRTEDLHTVESLAMDYIKHLRHHVHQVLELEPVGYP
jgi:DinB superfamily